MSGEYRLVVNHHRHDHDTPIARFISWIIGIFAHIAPRSDPFQRCSGTMGGRLVVSAGVHPGEVPEHTNEDPSPDQ